MSRNVLDGETSPYLLQHKDNPVHWQPWTPETLARAKAEGRPILLSVGYAACHWCHVMAHESFEDPATAEVMNTLFVNIKVDREERPDVDQIYQSALALLGQQGGWPLTMFLTPEGDPFWGGTYFPPSSRWGRPGFTDVLRQVYSVFREQPDKVAGNVDGIRDGLAKLSSPESAGRVTREMVETVARRAVREFDPFWGGLGHAPKFPQPTIMEMLWSAWDQTRLDPYRSAVLRTMEAMCEGGIYDHLGGGFARYSTDDEWLVPHFEKMLYDNAQLLENLTMLWRAEGSDLHRQRAEETVAWVAREMIADGGGFAATLDADSEGEEGKFYVWSEAEVDAVLAPLGPDAIKQFKDHYEVTGVGNWEGKVVLNRRRHPGPFDADLEAGLEEARALLKSVRDERVWPGWDDKVLADWNGLMIRALAEASGVFGHPDWLVLAKNAFDFVVRSMLVDGRLRHSWRAGRLAHPGTLEDHANMASAAVALYEATGGDAYLKHALSWVAVCDARFKDDASGAYFTTADDTDDVPVRTISAADNAVPAGNGTLAKTSARLFHLTGDEAHAKRAEAVLQAFSGELDRQGVGFGTLLSAVEILEAAPLIVLTTGAGRHELEAAARRHPTAQRIIQPLTDGGELGEGHPASGKGPVDGKAAAYVCRQQSCSLPVTEPQALNALLGE